MDAFLVAMEIIPSMRDVLEEKDGIYHRVITQAQKTKALLIVSRYTWSSLPLHTGQLETARKNWSPSEAPPTNAMVSPSLYTPSDVFLKISRGSWLLVFRLYVFRVLKLEDFYQGPKSPSN